MTSHADSVEHASRSPIDLVRHLINVALGWLLAVLMALAVVNVLWQVFTRFILNDPSSYTEEAARYLLVWISLLASGYAVGSRSHLAIDLLPSRLTGRSATVLDILINACMATFAIVVLIIGGWWLAYTTIEQGQKSPAFGVRLGYIYLGVPAAGLIMLLYAALNTIDAFRKPDSESSNPTDAQSKE